MRTTQSLAAFREMIRRGEYVVMDTETTGLHVGEIVQIAIVDPTDTVLLDTLVKPVGRIPYETTRIHGITDDMVADAPGWAAVTATVDSLLRGRDVIVYNAKFDRRMMHQSAQAAGLPKTDWKTFSQWWCAMQAFGEAYATGSYGGYRRSRGRARWHKLAMAAESDALRW